MICKKRNLWVATNRSARYEAKHQLVESFQVGDTWVFPKIGGKTPKWMIWGYPYFWKHPYLQFHIEISIQYIMMFPFKPTVGGENITLCWQQYVKKKQDIFRCTNCLVEFVCYLPHVNGTKDIHWSLGMRSKKKCTLPETNSSPPQMDGWNTTFLLGFGLFSGATLVSGRVSQNKRYSTWCACWNMCMKFIAGEVVEIPKILASGCWGGVFPSILLMAEIPFPTTWDV